ncbi:DUF4241 domain-containing protein [Streptomyces mirabilis]|uniref:DUF4241 domain-containing protein n=1 Tax=Streptomyces mirabilis TaxID=68239 RepID=A0A1I2IAE4_9ACTN|nr:DUF4241 domain-containing protein [Streptomyces mirabilis]SFF38633.1 Protein of unknown function [Streptomyces mirabilis]
MIIDVTYGEGWDAASRTVLGPMNRQRATARDAAGEPYAVVLREEGRPQPVAVLHIAWAHGYFGVWAYDDRGRRTREFDLRRLEPERLFLRHVARWRYDTADLPEFAAQAGRVRVDLYPDGRGRKVSEPQGSGGGSLHTMADMPEEQRWIPVSEFGAWEWTLALVTDGQFPHALREAPETNPTPLAIAFAAANWQPPTPLRPRHLDKMFTPGTRFSPPYDGDAGPYVVQRIIDAEPLRLPTGHVIACDPHWITPGKPFTVAVPPGDYPTQITTAAYASAYEDTPVHIEDYTAARVLISEKPTVAWELALRPGEDPRTLRDGEFYGFGVDSGTGCFVDAVAATRLVGRENTLAQDAGPDGILVRRDPESGGNLIAYPSGMGDGTYPVWIGRDADGEITCLVADMLIMSHQELLND